MIPFAEEKGTSLVEVVVASALVGLAMLFALSALSAGAKALARVDERTTAVSLACSQIEYAKAQTYLPPPTSYPTITTPAGYSVSAEASALPGADANIQVLTVVVRHSGKEVLKLEGYKVNR